MTFPCLIVYHIPKGVIWMRDKKQGDEMTVYEKYKLLTAENKRAVTQQIEILIACQSCPR